MANNRPPLIASSPSWDNRSKRVVVSVLLLLFLLSLYVIRGLLIPIILSIVLAYIVEPIVHGIMDRTRISRGLAIALVYLVIIAALIAIPIVTIPQLIVQANNFISNIPRYVQEIGDLLKQPLIIGGFEIPINELPLEQAYDNLSENLVSVLQTVGQQSVGLLGSLASATLSTVGWLIVILVVSFYMVKDYRQLWRSIVGLVPPAYQGDIYRLGREISDTWNSFLRGQLILGLVIAIITFITTTAIGLPNTLLLALAAGLLEFLPNIGPVIASIPAIVLALFQSDASWLGSQLSPLLFALIVVGLYVIIQQVENLVLVPRIIGRSLGLHPLVVLLGALAGASVAGILGILLAAPILATARLIFLYIFRKLSDLPPFGDVVLTPSEVADASGPLTLPVSSPEP